MYKIRQTQLLLGALAIAYPLRGVATLAVDWFSKTWLLARKQPSFDLFGMILAVAFILTLVKMIDQMRRQPSIPIRKLRRAK